MSERSAGPARLLPWTSPNGNPCYLVGDGTGFVSRLADDVESVQLGMADDILDYAGEMLADRTTSAQEVRFLARGLADALRDVRRIADSREERPAAGSAPATGRPVSPS
ncbi:hypothetical protein [Streptomyces bugieae]|uniref:PPM-type phosphatase domain-containing protein n=1 Tax=Streptomyces bugieae TaxID=3098223 RepID=A0ABU7NQX2_9ACTN|nr:hypothetical protein [Streptomyces sp. DSM 41528]